MTQAATQHTPESLTGPFDSMRDFALALEAHGQLLRIPEMDQDRYEATGFAYRLIEEYGWHDAPAFLVERIRVDGEWLDGPVLGNVYGSWLSEALAYGAPLDALSQRELYRATFQHLDAKLDDQGNWPRLAPVEIDAGRGTGQSGRVARQ